MEEAICKAKSVKKKIELSPLSRFDKVYSRWKPIKPTNTGNSKYIPPHLRNDGKIVYNSKD